MTFFKDSGFAHILAPSFLQGVPHNHPAHTKQRIHKVRPPSKAPIPGVVLSQIILRQGFVTGTHRRTRDGDCLFLVFSAIQQSPNNNLAPSKYKYTVCMEITTLDRQTQLDCVQGAITEFQCHVCSIHVGRVVESHAGLESRTTLIPQCSYSYYYMNFGYL